MMPVYFHLESHLWIFYLFFFHGLLIQGVLQYQSSLGNGYYLNMTNSFEATGLAAFFISLSLNTVALLAIDFFDQSFELMKVVLPVCSVFCLFLIFALRPLRALSDVRYDFGLKRIALYLFVFLILFYNGGLIEMPADSWWHMSLANKIGLASSFSTELGHLTGEKTRYYPPVWHANLAMASILSGESIAVFWNSFTAWGGVFKVMSFYLLAFALSGHRVIALLSALFFVMLPGMGDSYLRVSSWPSHISYTAMFCIFFICFWMLDKNSNKGDSFISSVFQNLKYQKSALIALITLALIILFVHKLELLWVYIGMLNYFIVLIVCRFFNMPRNNEIEPYNNALLNLATLVGVLISLGACCYALIDDWSRISSNLDWMFVCLVLLGLFITLLIMHVCVNFDSSHILRNIMLGATVIWLLLILFSIDLQHLLSLLKPELAYERTGSHENPLLIKGFFGAELKLPSWSLQLRPALLYSGLVSLPLSLCLAILRPNRLTMFVCANSLIAFLFCVSPYLYIWLAGVLSYHSPWRIGMLIFHPIVLSYTVYFLWTQIIRPTAK